MDCKVALEQLRSITKVIHFAAKDAVCDQELAYVRKTHVDTEKKARLLANYNLNHLILAAMCSIGHAS